MSGKIKNISKLHDEKLNKLDKMIDDSHKTIEDL